MANVRDLLIRMSLDTTNYKTQIDAAKRELRLLKQEYAATASDKSLEDSAATLLANLQAQKAAIEAEIAAYQQGINTIKQKLTEVTPGSQNEQSLVKQAAELETKMHGAETALNNLESKISTMKMDNLLYQAQQLSTLFMSLKLGLSDVLYSSATRRTARTTPSCAGKRPSSRPRKTWRTRTRPRKTWTR